MINKIKNKLKIKLRNYKISKISFQEYSDYKNFFIQEDKKSNWESSTFSEIIEKYLKQNKKLNLVEIGVARGETAKFTLSRLDSSISTYTGVDPYESNYDSTDIFSHFNQQLMDNLYIYVVEKINDPRFNLMRKKSNQAYLEFEDNSIDAIFIDGNHSYSAVLEDIKNWRSKIKKNGLMIGDDYLTFDGVRKAVEETFRNINQVGNTWFVKI